MTEPAARPSPIPAPSDPAAPALRFEGVDLDRVGNQVLHGIDLVVGAREWWMVLGPNGSGKTTMFQLASGYLHPTRGRVEILGHRLGRVDIRVLRERIGLVSAAVAKMLVPSLTAKEIVVSARHGALEPWWHRYSEDERSEASALLASAGFSAIADRPFGVLSEGERQQVLLARSLMARPDLLLLDEPAAGLDVGGRERLVARLGQLTADPSSPPTVMITHHVEEIPIGASHVLLLREGQVVAAGPLHETLTDDALSATFGLGLRVGHAEGRWTCRAT
jgi:iron complex transport system ATP-binding protein